MISARIDPIGRDLLVSLKGMTSPEAQSRMLADVARQEIAKATAINAAALGAAPPRDVYVDGQRSEQLERVRPTGTILAEFRLIGEALEWIDAMLILHAPVRTGRYAKSHILFADDVETSVETPPAGAREFAFVNAQPYARKIEKGLSRQAPRGVYDVVADLAQRRFGNLARVRFGYRSLPAGAIGAWAQTSSARALAARVRRGRPDRHTEWLTRQPAVIVTPR